MPKAKSRAKPPEPATELDLAVSGPISGGVAATIAESPEELQTVWDNFDWSGYTEQEKLFIEFYCANPTNATTAAINAGYSAKTAHSIACQMLKKPRINSAIGTILGAMHARVGMDEQSILYELFIVMTSNMDDYDVDDYGNVSVKPGIPAYAMRAVKGVTKTVVRAKDGSITRTSTVMLWDKPSAIRMAGQYRKMFTDKVDVNVDVNVKQVWEVGDKKITF